MSTVSLITPWDDAVKAMRWNPGEHVTLIGPTGRGKTELLIALLARRNWKIFLSTKNNDSTQRQLRGYSRTSDPYMVHPEIARAFLFVPRKIKGIPATAMREIQAGIYRELLVRIRDQGGWTVGLDEVRFLTSTLGLAGELELLWLQGRSEGISLVSNTQRPRHVPLEAYSQATHLFIWSTADDSDVDRLMDFVPGLDAREIESRLRAQSMHDVLYVNTVTGATLTTNTRE